MSGEEAKPEEPQKKEENWDELRDRDRRRAARGQDEKDEKDSEKSEKDEKFTRDPLSGLTWALIFIGAGVILLVQSMGVIQWDRFGGAWHPILIFAGLVVLLEAALRLVIPAYRRSITGTVIFAFLLLAMGLGGAFGWNFTWAFFLIAIGIAMILGGLTRGRL